MQWCRLSSSCISHIYTPSVLHKICYSAYIPSTTCLKKLSPGLVWLSYFISRGIEQLSFTTRSVIVWSGRLRPFASHFVKTTRGLGQIPYNSIQLCSTESWIVMVDKWWMLSKQSRSLLPMERGYFLDPSLHLILFRKIMLLQVP